MSSPTEVVQSIKLISSKMDETLRAIEALNDKIFIATARLVAMNRMLGKISDRVVQSK